MYAAATRNSFTFSLLKNIENKTKKIPSTIPTTGKNKRQYFIFSFFHSKLLTGSFEYMAKVIAIDFITFIIFTFCHRAARKSLRPLYLQYQLFFDVKKKDSL